MTVILHLSRECSCKTTNHICPLDDVKRVMEIQKNSGAALLIGFSTLVDPFSQKESSTKGYGNHKESYLIYQYVRRFV